MKDSTKDCSALPELCCSFLSTGVHHGPTPSLCPPRRGTSIPAKIRNRTRTCRTGPEPREMSRPFQAGVLGCAWTISRWPRKQGQMSEIKAKLWKQNRKYEIVVSFKHNTKILISSIWKRFRRLEIVKPLFTYLEEILLGVFPELRWHIVVDGGVDRVVGSPLVRDPQHLKRLGDAGEVVVVILGPRSGH